MSPRKNSTKRSFCINGLALLAAAVWSSNAVAEEKFQKLTGGQIRAKLAGMELTDNVHWRDLASARRLDGALQRQQAFAP
jgi:hypothetical protein